MKIKLLLMFAMLLFAICNITAQTVSISPASAGRNQVLQVTITGVGTNFNQGSNTVQFFYQGSATSNIFVGAVQPSSATSLTAGIFVQASATIGFYSFKVSNATDGTIASNANAFSVVGGGPEIVSVQPNNSEVNKTLDVTITGSGLDFTQGSSTVQFFYQGSQTTDLQVNNTTVISSTQLKANVTVTQNAMVGNYDLTLFNTNFGAIFKQNAFSVTAAIGFDEYKLNQVLKVYPNPFSTQFNVDLLNAKNAVIEVYDISGKLVSKNTFDNQAGNTTIRVDVQPGIYILKAVIDNKQYTQKLIKQ